MAVLTALASASASAACLWMFADNILSCRYAFVVAAAASIRNASLAFDDDKSMKKRERERGSLKLRYTQHRRYHGV